MSKLVEMIEALQKELDEPGRHQGRLPEGLAIELSVKLDPILAAAREQEKELAAMKEQHSTDLRDVAEMAIHGCKRSVEKLCDYPTADSIVREFREKKAEVNAQ